MLCLVRLKPRQTVFRLVQTCSDLSRLVQTCSDLSRLVQTCPDLFSLVQTCPNLSVSLQKIREITFHKKKQLLWEPYVCSRTTAVVVGENYEESNSPLMLWSQNKPTITTTTLKQFINSSVIWTEKKNFFSWNCWYNMTIIVVDKFF